MIQKGDVFVGAGLCCACCSCEGAVYSLSDAGHRACEFDVADDVGFIVHLSGHVGDAEGVICVVGICQREGQLVAAEAVEGGQAVVFCA